MITKEKTIESTVITDKNKAIDMLKSGATLKGYRLERISFENESFDYPVNFSGTELYNVSFKNTKFGTAELPCDAIFLGAKFSGEAYFEDTKFYGKADFGDTEFAMGAFFWYAEFHGETHFKGVEFHKEAYFRGAKLFGTANFWHAEFSKEANFGNCEFSKEANFGYIRFVGTANFEGTKFIGEAYFKGAKFAEKGLFIGTQFPHDKEACFTSVIFENPKAISFEKVYLGKTSFKSTDLTNINFTAVQWSRCKCLLWYRDSLYDDEAIKESGQQVKNELTLVEKLYKQLKLNYTRNGKFNSAGYFHYGELEMRRYSFQRWGNEWWRYTLYKLSSGYGEYLGHAILVFAALTLLFALGHLASGLTAKNAADLPIWKDYYHCLLYTLKSAFFLKDSLFEPSRQAGKLLTMIAQTILPVQTALIILTIKRKFKR